MIIKFLLILFLAILFPQTSSFSFYGQGELLNTHNASAIAQGDSKFFGQSNNGFTLSSPSTYYKNDFALFSMSMKFSNNYISNLERNFKNNFQLLFLSIPLSMTKSISFGMKPLYRSDINVYEDEYINIGADVLSPLVNFDEGIGLHSPMRYKSSFNLDGGISELFLSLSSKVGNKSSIGISFSRLFGTSKYRYNVDLYSLSYTIDNNLVETPYSENNYVTNTQRYSSASYMFDYSRSFKKFDLIFNFSNSLPLKVKLKEEVNFTSTIFDEDFYSNLGKMKSGGFGFRYNYTDYLSFNSEYHYVESFKPHDFLNIFTLQNPDLKSMALGMNYKIYNKNDYFDSLNFRMGGFKKDYSYDNFDIVDSGVTVGLSINYLNERNSLNFAFKIGKRKSDSLDFNNERYCNFYFTLNTSEDWFNNERNK